MKNILKLNIVSIFLFVLSSDIGFCLKDNFISTLFVKISDDFSQLKSKVKKPPPGMALIPAGCFEMGDPFNDGSLDDMDEIPVHEVCITKDFYMDIYEVTNAKYKAYVKNLRHHYIGT